MLRFQRDAVHDPELEVVDEGWVHLPGTYLERKGPKMRLIPAYWVGAPKNLRIVDGQIQYKRQRVDGPLDKSNCHRCSNCGHWQLDDGGAIPITNLDVSADASSSSGDQGSIDGSTFGDTLPMD